MMPRKQSSKWWVGIAFTILFPTSAHGQNVSPPGDLPPAVTTPVPGEPSGSPTPDGADAEGPPIADQGDESEAASQVASFAVTQLKDSPAVMTVLSGEDIRAAGARDLVDILMMVPGYFAGVDTWGVVGPGFRGIWGYEGKILLIIDGKEMNELMFSTTQLGNEFPVELIERVEVVRGPGSVIYGGNAELSVINIVTRGLQGSTDLKATATYGQLPGAESLSSGYGRRKLTLSGRYVVDAVPGLSTFASASIGQGQRSVRTYTDNVGTSASLEGASNLDPAVVQIGVGYKDVQASFLYHRLATTTITGTGLLQPPIQSIVFQAYHGELIGSFHPGSRFEIVPRFNFTYQTPWRDTAPGDAYYEKGVRRLRGRLLGRWAALDQLQITAGGDVMADEAKLLTPAGGGPSHVPFGGTADSVQYQTYAGYIELFSENPIVNVSAGARYDHMSTIGGALVPRLVLLRSFGRLNLKGLFSMSFREPGIENVNFGSDVRPERTRVIEFEAAVDLPAQQRVSANVFDLTIDKPLIYTVDPASGEELYLNSGKQGTRGFEIAYRLNHRFVRGEANYSFYVPSVSQNIENFLVPGRGSQFLAAPAHRGSLRANVRPFEGFGFTPSVTVLGPTYSKGAPDAAGAPTALEIPTQVLANLFIYKDNVGVKGLRLGVGFYNVFGANYRFVRASSTVPTDGSPAAVLEAYQGDHAPLPGLDREILLQLTYLFEPS